MHSTSKRTLWLLVMLGVLVALAAGCGSDDDGESKADPTPTAPAVSVPATTYETVDVQTAHAQLSANSTAIIVDVREEDEWRTTGIPQNARTIALSTFGTQAPGELPKDQPIYLICNSGNRSRVAAEQLLQMGYTAVVNVDGGIQAWLRAGLPTEPYTP